MLISRVDEEVAAALAVANDATIAVGERAEMLMEIAMGLQQRPKLPSDITAAVELYQRAEELAAPLDPLLAARIAARMGTAWQAMPMNAAPDGDGLASLEAAKDCYERAKSLIEAQGTPEEIAELEMNLGVTLQSLASAHRVPITAAISAYQRALRTFDAHKHPADYAILQNNLAIAFLAMPMTDERGRMREALAVQAFEQGLKVITLIDHPSEYAMLQNNLGNALQYASSSHVVENNLRALDAYDEALKVRSRQDTPLEYANTIANMANCLWNIPIEQGQGTAEVDHLARVAELYSEAAELFKSHGEQGKAETTEASLQQVYEELAMARTAAKLRNC